MYTRPSNLDDALGLLAEGARVMAGATDIFPGAGESPLRGNYVDVTTIAALRGVRLQGNAVRIGATTTWSDIVAADLPPAFDALKAAARDVGAVQIQNRGTVAGNLCNASPAADGVPPLLILDAEVELASRRGTRRLALDVFVNGARSTLLAPDEVMTAILTPLPASTILPRAKTPRGKSRSARALTSTKAIELPRLATRSISPPETTNRRARIV